MNETQTMMRAAEHLVPHVEAFKESSGVFQKVVALLDVADDMQELCGVVRMLGERFQSQVCVLRGRTKGEPLPKNDLAVKDLSCCSWPALETAVRAQTPSLVVMMETMVPGECAWFGTTTQRFLRNNKWPILILRPRVPLSFSSVLCLVDFSEAGLRALRTAARLARTENGSLTVLHVVLETSADARAETSVWHALKAQDARPFMRATSCSVPMAGDNRALFAAARGEVDDLLRQVDITGVRTQVVVTSGVPVGSALQHVREGRTKFVVAAQGAHLASTLLQMQSPAEELISVCPTHVFVQT